MSPLIRIYTVCHSVFHFRLQALFASVDMSKFKDGRVHFRNSGVKGLITVKVRHQRSKTSRSRPPTDGDDSIALTATAKLTKLA